MYDVHKHIASDPHEIARTVATLFRPGDVVEVRIPKTRKGTVSGYFNDAGKLAAALATSNGSGPGVYCTINPVKHDLLARAVNRLKTGVRFATSDADIERRRWLLIDCDAVRPAGISSTDAEHEAALERACDIRLVLSEEGWAAPLLADSGNGGHLVFLIDLPNDDASTKLLEAVLKALAARFDDVKVKIDQTVFNAARIGKAYGTVATKGDHTEERPHRLSRLLEVPHTLEPVSRNQLEQIAGRLKPSPPPRSEATASRLSVFDIDAFVHRNLQAREPVAYKGGRKWVLKTCPFNAEHTAPDSAVFEHADGSLGFRCLHNSCAQKHWQEVRALFEGPRQKRELGGSRKEPPKGTAPAPAPPRGEPMTLEGVIKIFQNWLYLPDPGIVTITLAAVAANRMDGDPVWLLLIGPPASGKTETLDALLDLPDMHPAGTLTEAALLSGVSGREKAKDASGGLLRAIGHFGFIVCKDFTSVLSMSRDLRSTLLAALREIYDGSWTRHVGTDGGKTLSWRGKATLIGGSTPVIDQAHAVMAAMGERFVLCRVPDVKAKEQAQSALKHVGQEQAMRRALRDAVTRLFANFQPAPLDLTTDAGERLAALSTLVARCRSSVERDSYRREIELVPGSERPARLVLALARLYQGMKTIGVAEADCWPLLRTVGLDCIPAVRRAVLETLHQKGTLSTVEVAVTIGYPTSTARRALEDLTAHGILLRQKIAGRGDADFWLLSDAATEWYDAVSTFSEMSGDVQ